MSPAASIDRGLAALEQAAPIAALRESTLAYPLVNTLHILGVALLFGAIVALDLRLMGWRRSAGPVDGFAMLLLPVATGGLLLAIPAGLLMFATDARGYAASSLFQAKMVLILVAIANALWLRSIDWRNGPPRPRVALAGGTSMALWLGVIVLGRMVGYF